jgi:hypothetical protein
MAIILMPVGRRASIGESEQTSEPQKSADYGMSQMKTEKREKIPQIRTQMPRKAQIKKKRKWFF